MEHIIASKAINSNDLTENNQETYFAILNNEDGSRIRQRNSISKLDSASSSMKSGVSTTAFNHGKRSFPSTTHYWNLDSSEKRFHSDDDINNGVMDGNGSFISLLNPTQQGIVGGFPPNTVLGSLADSTFPYQLSSLNWHN